jgi:hypothetical protein
MVRDDDLEVAPPRLGDLLDRGHAAINREDEPAALVGQPRKCFALDAVALLEAARQVPDDVRAELAQDEHRERGRADAVRVVVSVDADALAGGDRALDRVDTSGHVAEQERIVARQRSFQERARLGRVVVTAPNEHTRGRLAQLERVRKGARGALRARFDRPIHEPSHGTEAIGRRRLSCEK